VLIFGNFCDTLHRFYIDCAHQIEPEAIHPVMIEPERDGIVDEPSCHQLFRSEIISHPCTVWQGKVSIMPEIVAGNELFKTGIPDIVNVVEYYVKDDFHAVFMHSLHQFL